MSMAGPYVVEDRHRAEDRDLLVVDLEGVVGRLFAGRTDAEEEELAAALDGVDGRSATLVTPVASITLSKPRGATSPQLVEALSPRASKPNSSRARSSRLGLMSIMATRLAPLYRATCALRRPIGPAP